MSEDLNTKSLGEKLFDARKAAKMTYIESWADLLDRERAEHEIASLAFAASLSHDETANAVIASITRERDGYQKHLRACEQIAGMALGYPWFKDDQKNFPGTTEAEGVCIGEHVGDTIVEELATRFKAVTRERDAMKEGLRPFADRIVDIGVDEDDADRFSNSLTPYSQSVSVKVGDIRRAAALVNGEGGK